MIKSRYLIVALVLLCQVLGSFGRPTEVPDKCTPGKEYECPSTYSCYGTGIAGVGYCNCYAYYAFIRSPPTKDTLAEDDYTCVSMGLPWTLAVIVYVVLFAVYVKGIWEQTVLAVRLKRHGVLKNNMATRLLFLNYFGNYWSKTIMYVIMLLNFFKLDPNMWGHDKVRSYLFAMMVGFRFPIVLEALVGWIDIVQKSAKLTKTTSKGLTICQYILRAFGIGITITCAVMFINDKKIKWVGIDQIIIRCLIPLVILSAWRLNQIICPKMDRKNKNYSKAVGIWVLAITVSITILGYYMGIQLFIRNFFDASMGSFSVMGTAFWGIFEFIQGEGWTAYIKRGNKKILAQYEESAGGILGLFASSTTSTTSAVSSIEKSVVQQTDTKGRKSAMENIDEEA